MDKLYVLIVDDEESFVQFLGKRLRKRGLHVASALSGEAALKHLETHRNTDVVVLDVKMEGKDGIATLQDIKANYPLVEVIMLTGHATVESAVGGMKYGAFDYLMKPCDIDELMAKLKQAAEKKKEHEDKLKDAAVKKALSSYGG
jgi:DNA-binding NtrC family response regulator